jgi:hypothetical protein
MRERRYAPLDAIKRIQALEDSGGAGSVVAAGIDSEASLDGQVLTSDGAGNAVWETPAAGGAVDSVFGRTGAVTAAIGDYQSYYLVKTGGTETCGARVNFTGSLYTFDASSHVQFKNNTRLQLYDQDGSTRVTHSLTATSALAQVTPFPNATLTYEIGGGFLAMEVDCKLVANQASDSTEAGFKIVPGTAPTSPENGDIWITTTAMYVRINGTTRQLAVV